MIPIGGMTAQVALKLVDATGAKQRELIEKDAFNKRQIEGFRARIADIQNVEQLIADHEVYSFVMKAFDLEDQIFGKALMRKMLEGDINDREALVNRLSDPRFREMHVAMGFGPDGKGNSNTASVAWQEEMVDRFVARQQINKSGEQNEGVGLVLEFRSRKDDIGKWLDVLKNKDLGKFFRTALGLPEEVSQLDIDRQIEIFSSKFDLEKLKDPDEVAKLERRFTAIHDVTNPVNLPSNAAVQLMHGALSGQSWTPVTIDIPAIMSMPRGAYR